MNQNYYFGKKALLDALNHNQEIIQVYLSKANANLLRELQVKNIKVEFKDAKFFSQFNTELNHQGIAFLIKQKAKLNFKQLMNHLEAQTSSIVLILDSIEDPRNFGAILRTCDAFKVDAIFYKKNNQVGITDLVNKVSMGASNYLNTCEVANLTQTIESLQKQGYWVYATTLNDKAIPYFKEKYPAKVAVVVGNEDKGVSPLVIKNSDMSIYIPMFGHVQSLNVSVATAIVLSHLSMLKNN
ncbi:23S rRNA (guanosine(2251)-2'-O)-methyltransferase RlmB [Ureaplasma ceti]|uniref:23S rRNA (Guanosine(2251)-2'-O)-methyltransferase RlmB n=1 Tax=Ureaplasma ceti TaxID=3119530 RepID=A0ABP9UD78_9BACT